MSICEAGLTTGSNHVVAEERLLKDLNARIRAVSVGRPAHMIRPTK